MNKKVCCYLFVFGVLFAAIPSICMAGEVKLMFPKLEVTEEQSAGGKTYIVMFQKEQYQKNEYFEMGLSQFVRELENQDYKVDQIELWVEGRAESGGITRLFVSTDGKKGYKVILRPRQR
jgi:hypothetical protein